MKKIILLFGLIVAFNAQSQIVVKSLGTDSVTGLQQQINVWQLSIDAVANVVVVVYNIQTLSPNGKVVATGNNTSFTRYNNTSCTPPDMRFNALKEGALGQGIIAKITQDLLPVTSVSDLSKLNQVCPE